MSIMPYRLFFNVHPPPTLKHKLDPGVYCFHLCAHVWLPPIRDNMECLLSVFCINLVKVMVSAFMHVLGNELMFYGSIVFHGICIPYLFIQPTVDGPLG